MTIDEVVQEIETFESHEFCGGVSDSLIEEACEQIGLPFPPEYRTFLKRLGCGSIASESFLGLGGERDMDVSWVTKVLRKKQGKSRFPNFMIPVRADGYGNYDCIDTTN